MKYLYFIFLFIFLTDCFKPDIIIPDVSASFDTVLVCPNPYPYSIQMHIKGSLNSQAEIMEYIINSGHVDTGYLQDHYNDTFLFRYRPLSATKGKLEIDYNFGY